jgi:hypothetical protein
MRAIIAYTLTLNPSPSPHEKSETQPRRIRDLSIAAGAHPTMELIQFPDVAGCPLAILNLEIVMRA